MTTRRIVLATGVATLAAMVAGAAAVGSAPHAACSGKIVCPLTGELICRDQCPRVDPNRSDCPGRVECRVTGALICADRCPLETNAATTVPACCAKRGEL